MGAIVGVLIGYALGTRAGEDGWDELRDAWTVISRSEEVRDLLRFGFATARQLAGRGGELLAGSPGRSTTPLRPVA
jgi:hypothetical protein